MRNPSHDERISSFLDDALPEAERSALEAELRTNTELEQQVAELRQLRCDVALLPRYSAKEGFAQRVVAAAVAAKADQGATITPAAKSQSQSVRFSKVARGVVIGMAIAASAAILMISLPWLNVGGNKPIPVATNTSTNGSPEGNGSEAIGAEPKALAIVWSSLPGDGEALVLRIKAPKDARVSDALHEALVQQGVKRRRSADETAAGVIGNAYRQHVKNVTGGDKTKSTPSAAAMYLEISRDELELALTEIAKPGNKLEFVPSNRIALAKPGTSTNSQSAVGELPGQPAPVVVSPIAEEFVQDLAPSRFPIPHNSASEVKGPVASQNATPSKKVRVLILVEEVK
jgi:hypothetical protein